MDEGTAVLYVMVRRLHATCAIISGLGLMLRIVLRAMASPLLTLRLVRILPHVVDTVLLGSAVLLAYLIRQYPFVDAWLSAKVLMLLVYIVCGAVALRGRSGVQRAFGAVGAIAAYTFILSVAITHSPAGYLLPLLERFR